MTKKEGVASEETTTDELMSLFFERMKEDSPAELFKEGDLQGANLNKAGLEQRACKGRTCRANLEDADLYNAHLWGANLAEAKTCAARTWLGRACKGATERSGPALGKAARD